MAAIAFPQKVRDGELAKFAHVRCQKQGHQAVTAGPSHDESQSVIARKVECSGHTYEGSCRHPVGTRRHAVVNRRNPAARDIVFICIGGSGDEPNACIQQHCCSQETHADPLTGQAHLLCNGKQDQKGQESTCVPGVNLVQAFFECSR